MHHSRVDDHFVAGPFCTGFAGTGSHPHLHFEDMRFLEFSGEDQGSVFRQFL